MAETDLHHRSTSHSCHCQLTTKPSTFRDSLFVEFISGTTILFAGAKKTELELNFSMHFYHLNTTYTKLNDEGTVLVTSTAFYAMGSLAASPGLAAQLFNDRISIEAVSNGPVLTSFASTRLSISYGDRDSHEYSARPMRVQPLVTGT